MPAQQAGWRYTVKSISRYGINSLATWGAQSDTSRQVDILGKKLRYKTVVLQKNANYYAATVNSVKNITLIFMLTNII